LQDFALEVVTLLQKHRGLRGIGPTPPRGGSPASLLANPPRERGVGPQPAPVRVLTLPNDSATTYRNAAESAPVAGSRSIALGFAPSPPLPACRASLTRPPPGPGQSFARVRVRPPPVWTRGAWAEPASVRPPPPRYAIASQTVFGIFRPPVAPSA